MAAVPGIDVSSNQGVIDWMQVAASGQKYAFIRATMGRSGVDSRFSTNFRQARDAGLLVGVYHLVRPEWTAAEQINHFLTTLGERVPDFPPVLDVELNGSDLIPPQLKTPDEVTACVRECISTLVGRGMRRPIIYTAAWFWDRNIIPNVAWEDFDLWVANYGVSSPRLPIGWSNWTFWQYSSTGRVPGVVGDCDLNWFDGTEEDLLNYAKGEYVMPEPPRIRMRVTVTTLNIRVAPDVRAEDIGDLHMGDIIEINNIDGQDTWLEFNPGQWAAITINGERYMEWLPDTPPRARVLVSMLNIRNGPGMNYDDIGDLRSADMLNVLNLDGTDVWIELAPGQWAAYSTQGHKYMELVRE